ncbi:MAG: glycoside hydrolase family 127 protein, partial [Lentisphaeria bacterium]|nr:glycoside hydrolase family 127 protein [Lentisphaeria bacterium]
MVMNDSMLKNIHLKDGVFAPRQETNWKTTIPGCIRRCEETGRLKAFELKWKEGDPDKPHIYWDSDVAKVLEGMSASLQIHPDPAMEKKLDELIDLVIGAQQPDGYLNTHFTVIDQDKRWTNLHDWHELYCAGHLMESAVAHYQATGRRKFLDAMCRYADYIDSLFGRDPGKKRGYPGHEEIELALVKLYHASGEKRYLELARYFVEERGTEPNYFVTAENFPEAGLKNRQAHKPVREQTEADGHAVRAMYLFAGLADIAGETSDPALLECAERLFRNTVQRRMYITGGVGSTQFGEAFTHDFDLPNALAYAESCAAIGLALFAKRLLDITGKCEYADVLERVLYNNGLSGISLQGDTFFYANPLEVNETFFERGHIYSSRQKWFDCSCCPTNYCRFLPRLGLFCADAAPDRLRIDIPAAMEICR